MAKKKQNWYLKKFNAGRRTLQYGAKTLSGAYNMAGSALKTAKALKDLINVERKAFDYNSNYATQTTTMSLQNVSIIPQGDTSVTRDGYSMKFESFQCRYSYYPDPDAGTATQQPSLLRIMVVQCLGDNAPDANYILEGGTDVLSYRNIDGTGDFRMIYDKVHIIGLYDTGGYIDIHIPQEKLPVKHLTWSQSDTGGSAFRKGAIYVCAISDTVANPPVFQYRTRIRFVDN